MERQLADISLKGRVEVPASKSDAQRAILIAALAEGSSTILNVGSSNDVEAMIKNARLLGASVAGDSKRLDIKGIQTLVDSDNINFHAYESGLSFRMLAALCTALEGTQQINASGTLLKRSQKFIIDDISSMDCKVDSNNGFPPISIYGKSDHNEIYINASESSQFLSGMLITLPLRDSKTELHVTDLKSAPYVHMTLSTMKQFGIEIENQHNQVFTITSDLSYVPCTYTVEGDWSGASYWFVAAALGEHIEIGGLNSKSFQADRAILSALEAANCSVSLNNGDYTIDGSSRKAFEFDATDCPDLFPALVVLAAGCKGKSVIHGVSRLRNKESDRATVLQSEFSKLGLQIDLDDDRMIIKGTNELTEGIIDPHNDHRIAMSAAVSSVLCDGPLTIVDSACVDKSYPDFWKDFDALQ